MAVSANRLELLQIADAVAREKSIDRGIVIAAMEDAIQKAARSRYGSETEVRAEINPKTGEMRLSRLLLVCIPVLAGCLGLIIGRMIPLFRTMQPKIDTINRILREQITGMRVVRAFVREPAEAARFETGNEDLTSVAIKIGKLQALMWPLVMFVFNASTVAVLWFGAKRISDGKSGLRQRSSAHQNSQGQSPRRTRLAASARSSSPESPAMRPVSGSQKGSPSVGPTT